jgi:hypothetical protein
LADGPPDTQHGQHVARGEGEEFEKQSTVNR